MILQVGCPRISFKFLGVTVQGCWSFRLLGVLGFGLRFQGFLRLLSGWRVSGLGRGCQGSGAVELKVLRIRGRGTLGDKDPLNKVTFKRARSMVKKGPF